MLRKVLSCSSPRSLIPRSFQYTAFRTYSESSDLDHPRSSSPPITPSFFHEEFECAPSHSTFQPSTVVSIDRSGLCNHEDDYRQNISEDSDLVRHLKDIIKFRGGPISIAEYMEEVLTNPKGGFYINRDVFGADGDFVTSPEVSQMFGEMIGVWVMCLWEQMGQPDKINLIELGPGRGTLMADLLCGSSKFKRFKESLQIHLVECSPALRTLQHRNLKCADRDIKEGNLDEGATSMLAGDTPVFWHATLSHVPSGRPTVIIANEFFDALPIHQFQRTSRGWREKMVDVFENSFRLVLNPHLTPANICLSKRCEWASSDEIEKLHQIEICPKAMDLTHEICQRIGSDGGGALLIDYGVDGIVSDSLQAIRKHKFVNILDNPGSADISGYVDFSCVRRCAAAAAAEGNIKGRKVTVHGPKTQSEFLGAMGIDMRTEVLLRNCGHDQVEPLKAGYWRLVGEGEAPFWEGPEEQVPIGMGNRYLVMAIVNSSQGPPLPF